MQRIQSSKPCAVIFECFGQEARAERNEANGNDLSEQLINIERRESKGPEVTRWRFSRDPAGFLSRTRADENQIPTG